MSKENSKKHNLVSLILMIFTSVFGFANMPRSFYLMGYGAIPWYVLSAITFFIPFAFMMAEYGAAFKDEKGGIYSWMSKSVNPKYAFVGTFMWYASYIIWMVNVGSAIWVVFSTAIFGTDTTSTWSLFGLKSTQTLGLLGIAWIVMVTYVSSKGLDKIKKITSVGGIAVTLLNVVLLVGAIAIFIGNGGQLAQPITGVESFIKSPNMSYQSPIAVLAFLVFALFAYGGTEVAGGLVDQTENAEVTFPKGITVAAVVISVGYAIGIFLCGVFVNWSDVLSSENVHMGNVAYVIMNNMGYELGQAFGLGEALSVSIGNWIARYVGISMLLALTGAFAKFKKNSNIKKPFEIFKSYKSGLVASIVVTFTVGFANFFTIIDPAVKGDMASTIWSIAGPVFFTAVALIMFNRYEKRQKKQKEQRAA